jgi:tRNA (guanine-N7-)-methyltransferase
MENLTRSQQHFATVEQWRQELRTALARQFPTGGELVWEVGCGHGHFLAAYAARHPEVACVGVDLSGDRIERALRKRDRARLANLHFFRAEAGLFLEVLPAEVRITDTFVLFPDPWPKLRHQKHRVLQPRFLHALAAHATPTARLFFRTDFRPYFDETRALLAQNRDWRLVDSAWPFEFETVFQSRAASYDSLVASRIIS